ncbi:MAG: helix-turn-helix domain-containing protein [Betaproteobacteria bacterium]|nr:MAG: helix-turn-helix domain-containing protein [Betaproteobacteria bacterium]
MTYAAGYIPQPQDILRAWMPFKETIGVTKARSEADYQQISATVQALLAEIGDDETHPLADVLDWLSDQMHAYEDENFPIPEAEPREVLRFLMDQHGLKQEDLADCAPQSRVSDILNGRRSVSKEIAKKLARRFSVSADLFL